MNAVTPIISDQHQARLWEALAAWNQQRGKMIEMFARSELVITRTLQFFADQLEAVDRIKIASVASKRTEQLIILLSPGAPWAQHSNRLLLPLSKLRDYTQFRNFLCHGHATLYASSNGNWVVRLEMLSVAKGRAQRQELLLTEEEIQEKVQGLNREITRVANMLSSLEKKLCLSQSSPSAPAVPASR